MNKTHKQQGDGFTIIEVVLVLAIAALILLMVFLALPALQRGQRDTQRKQDMSRLQSAVNTYKSSNRGQAPAPGEWGNFFTNYLKLNGDEFADPSGEDYAPVVQTTGSATMPGAFGTAGVANENIYIFPGASCNGSTATGAIKSAARKVAIVKPLEGGGFFCGEA